MPGRTRTAAAIRATLVLGGLLLAVSLVLIGTAGPGYGRTHRSAVMVHLAARVVMRCCGIRLCRDGTVRPGPALVVANHTCWVDVLAVAATAPVVVVARCEIAGRPLIGALARRTGTVFVRPRVDRDLPAAVGRITTALRRGHRVLLFPEGTTSRGGPPGTFRRAGFQAAVDAAAPMQAVSIRYADGLGRPTVSPAFVDDDSLLIAAWRVLRSGPLLVRVQWHAPAAATEDGGHRTAHRARAADGARRRIDRALGAGRSPVDTRTLRPGVISVSRAAFPAGAADDKVRRPDQPDRAA